MIRKNLLQVDRFKEYVNFTRVAAYPDIEKFERERECIETSWPAYANDFTLCRPSSFLAPRSLLCVPSSSQFPREEMTIEEKEWTRQYRQRLQHVMSRMNHHIHPLINAATGERRPLRSCIPKGKKSGCRSNFPLDNEIANIRRLSVLASPRPRICQSQDLEATLAACSLPEILPG